VSPANYSRRAVAALILSSDPLGAALLGGAVELLGFRVVFPRETERGPDALRRVRPGVVLVDARDEFLSDASVVGPSLMTGARLVLFGAAERLRDLRVIAERCGAQLLTLPDEANNLPRLLSPLKEPHPSKRPD